MWGMISTYSSFNADFEELFVSGRAGSDREKMSTLQERGELLVLRQLLYLRRRVTRSDQTITQIIIYTMK